MDQRKFKKLYLEGKEEQPKKVHQRLRSPTEEPSIMQQCSLTFFT